MFSKNVVLLIILISLSACSKSDNHKNKVAKGNADLAKMAELQRAENEKKKKLLLEGKKPNKETSVALNEVKMEDLMPLVKDFCNNINGSSSVSLDSLVKMGQTKSLYWLKMLQYMSQTFPAVICDEPVEKFSNSLVSVYAIPAVLNEELKVYFTVAFSFSQLNELLSTDLAMLHHPIQVQHNMVSMRDGKKMSTYILSLESHGPEKKGAVYLKTPYLQNAGAGSYMMYAADFLSRGQNVVLQANRGSELSEGEFGWLDPVEVADSYDTLDWWMESEKSNGRVLAFGVSYDGFNALTAVSSRHPSLVAGFSCSAPAAAATDSISAGSISNIGILDYVMNRRGLVSNDKLSIKINKYLSEQDDVTHNDLDSYLYGYDSKEWSELLRASRRPEAMYWKERDLLPHLLKAEVPVFHFAGLDNDQDGRDPILIFRRIQEKLGSSAQHYLRIHPEGHGCGSEYQKTIAFKYSIAALSGETLPLPATKVEYFTASTNEYTVSQTLDFDAIIHAQLPLLNSEQIESNIESNLVEILDGPDELDEVSLKETAKLLVAPVDKNLIVNGMIKLKMVINNDIPNAAINVGILAVSPVKKEIQALKASVPVNFLSIPNDIFSPTFLSALESDEDIVVDQSEDVLYEARSFGNLHGLMSQANTISLKSIGLQVVEFEFLPTLQQIPEGSVLYIGVSTRPNIVDDVSERADYFALAKNKTNKISIHADKSAILLPTEKL